MLGPNHSGVYRGGGYVIDSGAVTISSAHTTGGNAGTIKFVNGFVNPATSDKTISILYAVIATVSGTPAGPFYWNSFVLPTGVAVTSAVTGTVQASRVGATAGNIASPQVNVVVTLTAGATTAFNQFATIGGPAAVAAAGNIESVAELGAGRVTVPPGTVFGICATGAGTTHVVESSIYFEELVDAGL